MLVAAVCAAGIAGAAAGGFGQDTGRVAQSAAIGAGFVVVARAIGYEIVRLLRRRGAGLDETIVLGGGPVAAEITETLLRSPEYGLRPVGFVDESNGRDLPLPFLGSLGELPLIVDRHGVRRLIVAFGPGAEEDLVDVLRAWDEMPLDIYVVPRLFELGVGTGGNADDVNGIPLAEAPSYGHARDDLAAQAGCRRDGRRGRSRRGVAFAPRYSRRRFGSAAPGRSSSARSVSAIAAG